MQAWLLVWLGSLVPTRSPGSSLISVCTPRPVGSVSICGRHRLPGSSFMQSLIQPLLCAVLRLPLPFPCRPEVSRNPAEAGAKVLVREALTIQVLPGTQGTTPAEDKLKCEMGRAHTDTHLGGRESAGPDSGKTSSRRTTEPPGGT